MTHIPILTHMHKKYCEIVGKKTKIKECYFYKNNSFFNLNGMRLILMSDLHSLTDFIIDDLIKKKKIDKNTIVISTGDMAGNNKIGGDGSPYESYLKILKHCNKFDFVNGNHDIYNEKYIDIKNDDNTNCMVDMIIVNTIIGKISGLNGIEVSDDMVNHHLYKYSSDEYNKKLNIVYAMEPDIILTHQPLKNIIKGINMCGHYHIDPHIQSNQINMDNKILIFED